MACEFSKYLNLKRIVKLTNVDFQDDNPHHPSIDLQGLMIYNHASMSYDHYRNYKKFEGRTILSIDYGTKVTGLGFYTPGKDPYPLVFGKVIYKSDDQLANEIKRIVDDEVVEIIVLGLPLHKDGNPSEMTDKVKSFSEVLLSKLSGIDLFFQDETLTSYEAEQRMLTSPRYNFKVDPKQIDALAASIILEDFIKSDT